MPVFLEPGQKYPVVLDCDKDKTPCPTFYAKSQSMRGQLAIGQVLDAWTESDETLERLFEMTREKLAEVVIGWSGMVDPTTQQEIPFSPDSFVDVLSYAEARELLTKVAYNRHFDAVEEKKSDG